MTTMRLCVHILAYKEKVYFAPYMQNINGHVSYHVPFEMVDANNTPLRIGECTIYAIELAKNIDIQREALSYAVEGQLQIKTWAGVLKKCYHAFIFAEKTQGVTSIKINRAIKNKGGLLRDEMYRITLDDPEDIGKKVLEALYFYKKV